MFLLVSIRRVGAHPDARDDVAAGTAGDTSRTNENMRRRHACEVELESTLKACRG